MKTLKLLLFVALLMPFAALAQPADPAVTPPVLDWVAALAGLLSGLVSKYPVVSSIFMVIGILRLIFKPLVTIIETVVKQTPSTKDDEALEKFERGPVYKWIIWVLDLFASVKPVRGATTNPLLK